MHKKIITFDIGGTNIKYGIADKNANIYYRGKYPTPQNLDDFLNKIKNTVDTLKTKINKSKIDGIAISIPGAVDNSTGIIKGASAVPYIHNCNMRELITKTTGFKVSFENDANCAALAEVWKGAGKDVDDALFVICGTGIGGSIIKNKKIHTGKNLYGGEFGYMIMDRDFETGKFKNWSEISSTSSIVRNAARLMGISPRDLNGVQVFQMAEEGNRYCIKAIETFYQNFATGLYTLQYIYDPEVIIIGGAISEREDLIDKINEKLEFLKAHIDITTILPSIKRCKYGNDANLIGAVYNYINK